METIAEGEALARTLGWEEDATCESEAAGFQRVFLPGCFPLLASDISEMSSSSSPCTRGHVCGELFKPPGTRVVVFLSRGGEKKKCHQVDAGGCILFIRNKENTQNADDDGLVTSLLLNDDKNKSHYAQACNFKCFRIGL